MMTMQERSAAGGARPIAQLFQTFTKWILIAVSLAGLVSVVLAAAGVWPWLGLDARLGEGPSVDIGRYVQIGFVLTAFGMMAFLPAVDRLLALERSHRDFHVTMDDVARAYARAHAADREGVFTLSSEFDAVRERLLFLREHPDLARLEPEVMELAAQMSHTTRDLADIYNEEKVARAKAFLKERQRELSAFSENLALALSVTDELKRYQRDVEDSERQANRQMDRLEKDLREVLPQLGYEMESVVVEDDHKVVQMQGKERPN